VTPRSAGLLAALLLLADTGAAWAHNLLAEYRILPGGRVRIESWFETGDSPPGARVRVYRADGSLLCEGTLDRDGFYTFPVTRPEALRVEVNDRAGHRAEVYIPAQTLAARFPAEAAGAVGACVGSPAAPLTAVLLLGDHVHAPATAPEKDVPSADRSHPFPLKDILAGVGFLLGLAAFLISLHNARALAEIKKTLPPPPP
jgi:hypothetical protein